MNRFFGGGVLITASFCALAPSLMAQVRTFVFDGVVQSISRTDAASPWTAPISVGDAFEFSFQIDPKTPRGSSTEPEFANYRGEDAFGFIGPVTFQSTLSSGPLTNVAPDFSVVTEPFITGYSLGAYITTSGIDLTATTSVLLSLYSFDQLITDQNIPSSFPLLSDFMIKDVNLAEVPDTGPGEQFSDFSADISIERVKVLDNGIAAVPEPATYGLCAFGLLGLLSWRKNYWKTTKN